MSKKIRISGGGILIIDYGNFDKTMKNTLQSISNHKYNNILNNFILILFKYFFDFIYSKTTFKGYQL